MNNNEARLGEYIYMGMGKVNGHRVCMSVAYHLAYSVKKALEFEKASNGWVVWDKINKVRVGDLEAEESFSRECLERETDKSSEAEKSYVTANVSAHRHAGSAAEPSSEATKIENDAMRGSCS